MDEDTINLDNLISDTIYYQPDNPESNKEKLSIMSLNCQSLNAKIDNLRILIEHLGKKDCIFDCICLQETWLNNENCHQPTLHIEGYNLITQHRRISRHGGLALYIRDNLTYKVNNNLDQSSDIFESLSVTVNADNELVLITNIYRPPNDIVSNYELFTTQLSELTQKIQNTGVKNTIVAGDFNINFLKIKERPHYKDFLNSLLSSGFLPRITVPSRVTNIASFSLIDNLFTKLSQNNCTTSGVLVSPLSDHFPVFIDITIKSSTTCKTKSISKRSETQEDLDKLKNHLSSIDLYNTITSTPGDVNAKYAKLNHVLMSAIDKFLPMKTVKFRKNKHPKSPWLTHKLLKLINHRNKLHREFIQTNTEDPAYETKRLNYVTFRNIVAKDLRNAKKLYYEEYFERNKSSMVKTWSKINEIVKQKSVQTNAEQSFIYKGKLLTDSASIADSFNEYFAQIGEELSNSISTNVSYADYLPPKSPSQFSFTELTNKETDEIICNLKSKSSSGVDGLSMKVLKYIKEPLIPSITILLNMSFQTGNFPQLLKIAKVLPIFKNLTHKFLIITDLSPYYPQCRRFLRKLCRTN